MPQLPLEWWHGALGYDAVAILVVGSVTFERSPLEAPLWWLLSALNPKR